MSERKRKSAPPRHVLSKLAKADLEWRGEEQTRQDLLNAEHEERYEVCAAIRDVLMIRECKNLAELLPLYPAAVLLTAPPSLSTATDWREVPTPFPGPVDFVSVRLPGRYPYRLTGDRAKELIQFLNQLAKVSTAEAPTKIIA